SAATRRRAFNAFASLSRTSMRRRSGETLSSTAAPSVKSVTAADRRSIPSSRDLAVSASTRILFSIICAKGSPGSTSPAKVRKVGRTASPSRLSVPRHIENWLGVGSAALPNAKRLEQPTHRGDDRGGAFVIGGRGTAKARVRDDNDEAIAERLAQSNGEREPGEAAAGNQDIK